MDDVKRSVPSHLKISEDVVITIANLAAVDVKGVAGLAGEISKFSKLRKNNPITVSMLEDVVAIDVRIKVVNGVNAGSVAQEVQSAVKENVQSMTGIAVARVNVIVCGVVF